jgi:hypothetical protein
MTAPMRLRLDQAARAAVSERYEHAHRAVERTNCQIVLLADEGRHATENAWLVRRKAPGRALQITPVWLAELQSCRQRRQRSG